MTEEREQELKEFMELELEQTGGHFDYLQWDGFIEDEDDPMTHEELQEMEAKYRVEVRLVAKAEA